MNDKYNDIHFPHPAPPKPQGRPRIGRKFSVVLPEEVIAPLKELARKNGHGYLTHILQIFVQHVEAERAKLANS